MIFALLRCVFPSGQGANLCVDHRTVQSGNAGEFFAGTEQKARGGARLGAYALAFFR